MKKLVVFDLDGTLAVSKSALDDEMAERLHDLLATIKVAVISGGDWAQFEKQLLANLPDEVCLSNLSPLPTCGTKFYQYASGWRRLYAEEFTDAEKEIIVQSLKQVITASNLSIEKTWGEQIEDRGTQITFSALGQLAPIEEKETWDPDFSKRKRMKSELDILLPSYLVRLGGTTSIDITKQGIDKAYGIGKLRDILDITIHEMIFLGDALFPGGNDYPVKEAGVASIHVKSPEETKRAIDTIIACLT